MDNVDGSDHYAVEVREPPPSLLNVIIDTNPYAWALLKETLPLSKAIANLEVFINAHLAFNHANQVTIIASHLHKAEFLYPPRRKGRKNGKNTGTGTSDGHHHDSKDRDGDGDVEMTDEKALSRPPKSSSSSSSEARSRDYANFYRPFADVKACLDQSLASLMEETSAPAIRSVYSTSLAGALSLALAYTNKIETALNDEDSSGGGALASSALPTSAADASTGLLGFGQQPKLHARIMIVSASSASASQYIPLMNTVFAAQRRRIPIDVLSIPLPIGTTDSSEPKSKTKPQTKTNSNPNPNPKTITDPSSSSSFLQQAADATSGIFIPLDSSPHGLLQTLLMAFLPTQPSRDMLIMPTTQGVDFRAACFCHQTTVDIGFVCSVCLSIFCDTPPDATCLTCGSPLKSGGEGWARPPAVLPKRRKKKRRREDDDGNGGGGGGGGGGGDGGTSGVSRADTPA